MLTLTPTATRLPGSPAQIHPETSLADLRALKAAWAQSARELGYPEMAYQVTAWLGREVVMRPSGRIFQVWSSGNVFALTREYAAQYLPELETHLVRRSLVIYIGQPDTRHTNLVDQIVLSDQLCKVADWRWQSVANEWVELEQNYFLPGFWFNAFLNADLAAEAALRRAHREHLETERLNLLAEMLAGQVL
jgi:hypothetical protein